MELPSCTLTNGKAGIRELYGKNQYHLYIAELKDGLFRLGLSGVWTCDNDTHCLHLWYFVGAVAGCNQRR
jgi:hypothetical protein